MRILFLCPSIAAGKDGIGDYICNLAGNLRKEGMYVSIIAVRDRYLEDEMAEEIVDEIPVLRLSYKQSLSKKRKPIQNWIDKTKPELISLQYVPYGYQKKGLPLYLPRLLKLIVCNLKLHIMFHELWLGEAKDSSTKEKLIGFLQRKISLQITKQSFFDYVFTNSDFYKKCFNREHVDARVLPIFNSLPVGRHSSVLFNALPQPVHEQRKHYVIGCFFGATHYHLLLHKKIASLQTKISSIDKKLVVLHIGKGKPSDEFIRSFESQNIEFITLGEQQASDVADLFSCVDIGLSTYPKILYQKSSSMAAMLNNDLPVILLRDSFEEDTSQVNEVKEIEEIAFISEFIYQPKKFSHLYSAGYTVKQYIELFN